jgi:hypothetical protein
MNKSASFLIIFILMISCKPTQHQTPAPTAKMPEQSIGGETPQVVVYKTISDFSNYVPVIMNPEKNRILSYPAPTDLVNDGKIIRPIVLKQGYLLDQRGINENVAYLKITLEEYVKLTRLPSPDYMLTMILEKNPLAELWYCGKESSFTNKTRELNKLIRKGFPGCTKANLVPLQIELKL